ncbi:glycoside hydrolase family 27 protein [Jaapia argillacea MUCL 33604]|uniref:Alpha-galactosidase n=1 Tax=Jaapia argillacea MUCL 33604 TaxID=933084 RepID=A0A067P703_9AGAM|nr:glycoside hydrolase family 27 protein [Jaapia argillacea MUCL 33604]
MHSLLPIATAMYAANIAWAYNNGLAITPQMGWNTWNYFGCDISEDTILSAARTIVAENLVQHGYQYVLMDDCWQAPERDKTTGAPIADPEKFPNGIKALSDELHTMGLKFGIYSSAGQYTCGGRYGSLGYETIDAQTYASWGVDYLKYDNCYNDGRSGTPLISFERYQNMSLALNATGRPILYSMCNWGEDQPWNWATTIANSWRISGDIMDNFGRYDDRCPCTSMLDCKLPGFHCAMARIIDFAAPFGQKAGPGRWNDLDMLEVGNGGMTHDEYGGHLIFAAISPRITTNNASHSFHNVVYSQEPFDPRQRHHPYGHHTLPSYAAPSRPLTFILQTSETYSIITNDAVIAINQDAKGSPATRIWKISVEGGDLSLWSGSLVNNTFVFALLNTSPSSQTVDIDFTDVFFDDGPAHQTERLSAYIACHVDNDVSP